MKKIGIIILLLLLGIIFFISFVFTNNREVYFSLKGQTNIELNIGDDYKEIDHKIKSDYDLIMKNCPNIISSQWEMVGENFKQFSLYETLYETKVTNSI